MKKIKNDDLTKFFKWDSLLDRLLFDDANVVLSNNVNNDNFLEYDGDLIRFGN